MPAVNNENHARITRWALVLTLVVATSARAQDGVSDAPLTIPPDPHDAAPRYVLDVHSAFSMALRNDSLCPAGSGCVLRSGGGIGVSLERRWPRGLGAMLGYDAWFLGTDSVYEIGVQQVLRAGARYTMLSDHRIHPVFELTVGGMGYGDTFAIATVGFLAQAFAGGEIELTETYGLLAGVGVRVFSHTEFRTERDRVMRGRDGLFTESLFFQLGLTAM